MASLRPMRRERSARHISTDFASDEEFLEYISKVRSWSVIDTGISVRASDQIITLSTCTNVNDGRFIVQAKRYSNLHVPAADESRHLKISKLKWAER